MHSCRITGAKGDRNIHASVSEQLKKNFAKSRWKVRSRAESGNNFLRLQATLFLAPSGTIPIPKRGRVEIAPPLSCFPWEAADFWRSFESAVQF